jgi:hypothetical protein
MGSGNAGKYCIVILEPREIECTQRVKEFRDLEEYQGLSVEISPEGEVISMSDKFNWCSRLR